MRVLLFTLLLTFSVTAQVKEPCDHVSQSKRRFDAISLTPPAKVLNWDGKRLEVKFEDKDGIYVMIFDTDKQSAVDAPKKDSLVWVLYCTKPHSDEITLYHAYVVTPVLPNQIKK